MEQSEERGRGQRHSSYLALVIGEIHSAYRHWTYMFSNVLCSTAVFLNMSYHTLSSPVRRTTRTRDVYELTSGHPIVETDLKTVFDYDGKSRSQVRAPLIIL